MAGRPAAEDHLVVVVEVGGGSKPIPVFVGQVRIGMHQNSIEVPVEGFHHPRLMFNRILFFDIESELKKDIELLAVACSGSAAESRRVIKKLLQEDGGYFELLR